MGIPSYFAHVVRSYRHIIQPLKASKRIVHNLYLDCNSLIYDAVHAQAQAKQQVQQQAKQQVQQQAKQHVQQQAQQQTQVHATEKQIIGAVCDKLVHYFRVLAPQNRVFIAFDGVAPVAKMKQQRNRRYMAWYQNTQMTGFNTAAITPGTEFMRALAEAVKTRFQTPAEFQVQDIIVSAADEPGEGEHKIYAYIRAHADYHATPEQVTVVYGLDADLIMLTLNHLHLAPRMYLYRETPEFIKNLDKTLAPNETYLLDIPAFAQCLRKELGQDLQTTHDHLIPDYIFMCFLLGNDFLPHFPALNIRTEGMPRLFAAYRHVFGNQPGKSLTVQQHIVWPHVREFLAYLATREVEFVQEEYKLREKQGARAWQQYIAEKEKNKGGADGASQLQKVDEFLTLPLRDRVVEKYINPLEEAGWEARYYRALLKIRVTPTIQTGCQQICQNYFEGLEWTMKYYSHGCVDWRWTYHYPYPPLLKDLSAQVPTADFFTVDHQTWPVEPLVQLCYVLPPSSLYLVPPTLHRALLLNWYVATPLDMTFQWSFCKFFWEAHVELPEINLQLLENVVNTYKEGTTKIASASAKPVANKPASAKPAANKPASAKPSLDVPNLSARDQKQIQFDNLRQLHMASLKK